ncbi:MAG: hypothetical protein N3B18_13575, partial [Desulfobacterota bacterium]|nr:hypothetical protein [Thermodesulfobacteriota bacterium]
MIDRQRLLRICNWSLTYNETLAQAQKPVCGDFPSTWENFIRKEPLVLQWGIMEVSNVDLYGSSLFGFKNDEFVLDLGINGNPYYLEKPDVKRACQYARTEFCCKKT